MKRRENGMVRPARLVLAVAVTVLAAGSSVSGLGAQGSGAPTDVRIFVPYVHGRLSPALAVSARLSGRCFAASIASQGRSDAWRCMSNNAIFDPCFEGFGQAALACARSPWSAGVTLLTPAEPLPFDHANRGNFLTDLPWAVELTDGARCRFITGTTTAVAGMRLNYECQDGTTSIVGDPDRTQPKWQMFEQRGDRPEVRRVGVATAWY